MKIKTEVVWRIKEITFYSGKKETVERKIKTVDYSITDVYVSWLDTRDKREVWESILFIRKVW